MKRYCFFLLLIIALALQDAAAQVTVTALRCERLHDPLGIDIEQPQLSWQLTSTERNVKQVAYQVIVSSSSEKSAAGAGDLWNSGKVPSGKSVNVIYAGKKLTSRTDCYWRVKVFTNKGESSWSDMAHWSMGLLSKKDWTAHWIGYDKASSWDCITQWSRLSARYFRNEFSLKSEVRSARIYIVGLGLYQLFINGEKIGDQAFAPAPTDYRKSVLYNTYDVTAALRAGQNAVGVVLGNGRFFTMRQNYKTKKHNTFGYPKLLLQLEIELANGRKQVIVSDGGWKLNVDGPIRTNNEYDGEEYDATHDMDGWTRPQFDDKAWIRPQRVAPPAGRIVSQMNPPVRTMGELKPRSIRTISGNRYILDMGQNFAGWLKLRANGPRGTRIRMRFAESLQPSGELYVANLRDAKVTDIYTLSGNGQEEWEPSFVYHGFRYVEISGYPGTPTLNDFTGKVIFDDLPATGSFWCSDSTVNQIHQNAWWSIASNYKGMPIDCPQRNERQPWLGDRATGAGGEAFLFDNSTLYRKWLYDIEQSQTSEGAIPDVAPAFWNYYSDNVTWPGTYLLVADMLYRQYGDVRVISDHYASMKKWMEYMRKKYMKEFIMTRDKYGDWCVPPESLELIRSKDSLRTTNGELIATAYYYRLLQLMKQFARLAGKPQDIVFYDKLGDAIKKAFNERFFNTGKSCYDNNTVTANLLPLYFELAPTERRNEILKQIYDRITVRDNMHISTGVIGTQWLMRALTENGYANVAFALASNRTYPSWGYMAEQGATTIWELWNGNTANPQMNSQNHVMLLGDLLIWLYEDVAGIKADDSDVAFHKVRMKPCWPDRLQEVKASYRSVYGEISSHWKKAGGRLEWNITVPANTTAVVYIPGSALKESSRIISEVKEIKSLGTQGGYQVFEIGSGSYSFTAAVGQSF